MKIVQTKRDAVSRYRFMPGWQSSPYAYCLLSLRMASRPLEPGFRRETDMSAGNVGVLHRRMRASRTGGYDIPRSGIREARQASRHPLKDREHKATGRHHAKPDRTHRVKRRPPLLRPCRVWRTGRLSSTRGSTARSSGRVRSPRR